MKSVIITGANGFLGSTLIDRFLIEGYKIYAVVKDQTENVSQIVDKAEIIYSELCDADLEAKLQSARGAVFYHFAWQGVNGNDKSNIFVQQNNITMALKCAELAKKLDCEKFLCAGTVAENVTESIHALRKVAGGVFYGVAKHCAHMLLETYCKNIGLDFVWMQFSNIYGPKNKTGNLISYALDCLDRDESAIFGPANQPYDFIFIDDLIEAVYRLGVMSTLCNFYFIGSGEPKILKEYLFEIGKAVDKVKLIDIGARPDDGIIYDFKMFDIAPLVADIGKYVNTPFKDGIELTIKQRQNL